MSKRPAAERHLGLNVYCWSRRKQNLLLTRCFLPALEAFARRPGSLRFFFDRIDCRGPHVMALFTETQGDGARLEEALGTRLEAFLADHPELSGMSREEVEARHESLRGNIYCAPDEEPGLAPEDSYRFFEQPPDRFPFFLDRLLVPEASYRLWPLVDELSRWSAARLDPDPDTVPLARTIGWLAAIDHVLAKRGEAEAYWRLHACSLLLDLGSRLEREEEQALAAVPKAVGERNRRNFDHIWQQVRDRASYPWPEVEPLVEAALGRPPETPIARRGAVLREVVHWTLKQCCVFVRTEIPLVLYAWSRHL